MNDHNKSYKDNLFWIIGVVFIIYTIISGIIGELLGSVTDHIPNLPDEAKFIIKMYTTTSVSIIVLILLCLTKKNRSIGRSFLPVKGDRSFLLLLLGLALGFLTNFFCILCAIIHGDIKLYLDFSAAQIPMLLFAFISVFIQSSSEELWFRGFMYRRFKVRYPIWVAVAVNGLLFGLIHSFNPGANVLAISSICITGLSYSLLRWYTDNIWICMGIHTMWNFTQNFLFGLPNSGLISKMSVYHLDAVNGSSNLIYDYKFGVEGALPAVFIDALLGIVILLLAKRNGRLNELTRRSETNESFQTATKNEEGSKERSEGSEH